MILINITDKDLGYIEGYSLMSFLLNKLDRQVKTNDFESAHFDAFAIS
tara:strand:- start:199 stop:342 length:144 start_codon:yes stop_codon:yes gene_type:complete